MRLILLRDCYLIYRPRKDKTLSRPWQNLNYVHSYRWNTLNIDVRTFLLAWCTHEESVIITICSPLEKARTYFNRYLTHLEGFLLKQCTFIHEVNMKWKCILTCRLFQYRNITIKTITLCSKRKHAITFIWLVKQCDFCKEFLTYLSISRYSCR